MGFNNNRIGDIRPGSRFDTFVPQNKEAGNIAAGLERLATTVGEKLKKDKKFDNAKLVSLWGKPGRGKTHLLEAFVAKLKELGIDDDVFLFRGDFTVENISKVSDFDNKNVIVIDDLYSENHKIDELHPRTDLKVFQQFALQVYETRRLVLLSTNFPIDDLMERVKEIDTIGRITSRISEMTVQAIELPGDDYRRYIADMRTKEKKDPFSL